MIVMLVIVMMFVVSPVVAEPNFTRQTRLDQEFESPVDGSVPDGRVNLMHEPVEILAREMLLGAQKSFEYKVTLPGAAQPGLLNMIDKNLFFYFETILFLWHAAPAPTISILPFQL